MEGQLVEIGIGGLFAITVIKTLLPYVKPAKNGHVAKDVMEVLRPIYDRQTVLLEKMNERDSLTHSKVCSNHENIKDMRMETHDVLVSMDAMHRRIDKCDKR